MTSRRFLDISYASKQQVSATWCEYYQWDVSLADICGFGWVIQQKPGVTGGGLTLEDPKRQPAKSSSRVGRNLKSYDEELLQLHNHIRR